MTRVFVGCRPTYFYPRPPRGGRRSWLRWQSGYRPISIHALREEGDKRHYCHKCIFFISIHALREEGDSGLNLLMRENI